MCVCAHAKEREGVRPGEECSIGCVVKIYTKESKWRQAALSRQKLICSKKRQLHLKEHTMQADDICWIVVVVI